MIAREKVIKRYGLTINGTDIYFTSKRNAIKAGLLIENKDLKMFEEYRLWYFTANSKAVLADHQRFDRTILIRTKEKYKKIK